VYGTQYRTNVKVARLMTTSTRERLIEAAFDLFQEQGFESTTVDDVAARAGVGRTTFFRAFRSKEDAIFPDHDAVLSAIRERLSTASPSTALVAVTESARLVLVQYLSEGERARTRYRLTRSVPALRDREIASLQRYQETFRAFLHEWLGGDADTALRAELMANAIVTAHNHVLRRWLRGALDPEETATAFDRAMTDVVALFERAPHQPGRSSLVVLHTTRSLEELMPDLRRITEPIDPTDSLPNEGTAR
jgi:AcrR family transcriptional regulator